MGETGDGRTATPVMLIAGAGPPAAQEFRSLLEVLDGTVDAIPWDLLAFRGAPLPQDYSLQTEADEINNAVRLRGLTRLHLVAYSGGAAVALTLASQYPMLVASLALVDPAWVGNGELTAEAARFWDELDAAMRLPKDERLEAFRRLMVHPNIAGALQPVRPDAPWVDGVLAGIQALSGTFKRFSLDYEALRNMRAPIYCAVGGLSNPVYEARARLLAERLPGTRVEVYEGLHHLYPPHRGDPRRFAEALRALWQRCE